MTNESKHHTSETAQGGLMLLAREGQSVSGITLDELFRYVQMRLQQDAAQGAKR